MGRAGKAGGFLAERDGRTQSGLRGFSKALTNGIGPLKNGLCVDLIADHLFYKRTANISNKFIPMPETEEAIESTNDRSNRT